MNRFIVLFVVISQIFFSCQSGNKADTSTCETYIPDDIELYQNIVAMDSVFFMAYNTCDLIKQAEIYADDIEFYHDKGGLMTSKQDILGGTENNICGKVTRELVKGSIEVYPINNFGAIEMGMHLFHNNQEPDAVPHASKFIIMWKNENESWLITKVVSLH